jgi:hypothetical protein
MACETTSLPLAQPSTSSGSIENVLHVWRSTNREDALVACSCTRVKVFEGQLVRRKRTQVRDHKEGAHKPFRRPGAE